MNEALFRYTGGPVGRDSSPFPPEHAACRRVHQLARRCATLLTSPVADWLRSAIRWGGGEPGTVALPGSRGLAHVHVRPDGRAPFRRSQIVGTARRGPGGHW